MKVFCVRTTAFYIKENRYFCISVVVTLLSNTAFNVFTKYNFKNDIDIAIFSKYRIEIEILISNHH